MKEDGKDCSQRELSEWMLREGMLCEYRSSGMSLPEISLFWCETWWHCTLRVFNQNGISLSCLRSTILVGNPRYCVLFCVCLVAIYQVKHNDLSGWVLFLLFGVGRGVFVFVWHCTSQCLTCCISLPMEAGRCCIGERRRENSCKRFLNFSKHTGLWNEHKWSGWKQKMISNFLLFSVCWQVHLAMASTVEQW